MKPDETVFTKYLYYQSRLPLLSALFINHAWALGGFAKVFTPPGQKVNVTQITLHRDHRFL